MDIPKLVEEPELIQPTLRKQPSVVTLHSSPVDEALSEHHEEAKNHISALRQFQSEEKIRELTDIPDMKGAVFVGHTNTDMDSIGSAIGAAELMGGIPARASNINPETEWALKYWSVECPETYAAVKGNRRVCIMDCNQTSQFAPGVEEEKIIGCIDHHALQSGTFQTEAPVYINIQPWGSCCSIVASMYVRNRRPIRQSTAGLMLCGILSDTLNLHSVTTTSQDRLMLTILAKLAGVEDVNKLAQTMFKAKSRKMLSISSHGLVRGDLKFFTLLRWKIAFGTCETVLPADVLARTDDLIVEMKALKKEKDVDAVFFTVVNILEQSSVLIICGETENYIAQRAYGGVVDAKTKTLDMGKRASRKRQFIPPLAALLVDGFTLPESVIDADTADIKQQNFGKVILLDCGCTVARKITFSTLGKVLTAASRFKKALPFRRKQAKAAEKS